MACQVKGHICESGYPQFLQEGGRGRLAWSFQKEFASRLICYVHKITGNS